MRKRNIQVLCRMTAEEKVIIEHNMKLIGTTNLNQYMILMATQGQIIYLDTNPLNAILVALNRIGNNLNQLTKKFHQTNECSFTALEELNAQFTEMKKETKQNFKYFLENVK